VLNSCACHDEPAIFASLPARVGRVGDNHLGGCYSHRAAKAAHNMLLRAPAESAESLLQVLSNLSPESSGQFYDWQGNIPW